MMEYGSILILFIGLYSAISGINGSGEGSNRRPRHRISMEDIHQNQPAPVEGGTDQGYTRFQRAFTSTIGPLLIGMAVGVIADSSAARRGTETHWGRDNGFAVGLASGVVKAVVELVTEYYNARRSLNNNGNEPNIVQSIINELKRYNLPLPDNVAEVVTDFVNQAGQIIIEDQGQ